MSNQPQQQNKSTVLESFKSNWFLIVFFMGMAVTWGSFSQKDKVQETRIEILEAKIEKIDDGLNRVNENLAQINTSLDFILEGLDKLNR